MRFTDDVHGVVLLSDEQARNWPFLGPPSVRYSFEATDATAAYAEMWRREGWGEYVPGATPPVAHHHPVKVEVGSLIAVDTFEGTALGMIVAMTTQLCIYRLTDLRADRRRGRQQTLYFTPGNEYAVGWDSVRAVVSGHRGPPVFPINNRYITGVQHGELPKKSILPNPPSWQLDRRGPKGAVFRVQYVVGTERFFRHDDDVLYSESFAKLADAKQRLAQRKMEGPPTPEMIHEYLKNCVQTSEE